MKKNTEQSFLKWGIAVGLGIISIIIIMFYLLQGDPVSLNYTQNITVPKTTLSPIEPLQFSIQAQQNNFNKVTIALPKHNTPIKMYNGDTVIFTIRDQSNPDQQIQSKHPLREFFGINSYTFTFPTINNSRDKVYDLAIQVVSPINTTIYLDKTTTIESIYTFKKQELSAMKDLIFFAKTKLMYSLQDIRFIAVLLSFVLPLVLYVAYIVLEKKLIHSLTQVAGSPSYVGGIGLALIFYNLPFTNLHPILYIMIILIWITAILWHKIPGNTSFLAGLLLLSLLPLYLILKDTPQAERLATWIFTFLIIGFFQRLTEIMRSDS